MSGGSFNYLYLNETGEIVSNFSSQQNLLKQMALSLFEEGYQLAGVKTYLFLRKIRKFSKQAWALEEKMRRNYSPIWNKYTDKVSNEVEWISGPFLVGSEAEQIIYKLQLMLNDYEHEEITDAKEATINFIKDIKELNTNINQLEGVREKLATVWKSMEWTYSGDSDKDSLNKDIEEFNLLNLNF